MKYVLIIIASVVVSGCMQIRTNLQPVNPTVKPILEGSDCVTVVFGIGFGSNTVERALRQGGPPGSYLDQISNPLTIARIHSLTVLDSYFMVGGHRCLLVTGEP